MIKLSDYFMGRDKQWPPTDRMTNDAVETVGRANDLLARAEMVRGVRSGYRPPEINSVTPNASKSSRHMLCQAIDIEDNDGKLKSWCVANLDVLEEIGLWLESPESTPTWCHLQIVPPGSGHRIFIP